MCANVTKRTSEYFWNESDLELIEFVKKHTLLYDLGISNNRHVKEARLELWCEFAERTSTTAKMVSARWSSIRHNYTTAKKRITRNSKYLDGTLSFLKEYLKPKLAKERNRTKKRTETPNREEELLKTTFVTQDMIEELIKIKSNDEKNIKESSASNMMEEEVSNILAAFDKSKVNSSVFSTIAETIIFDVDSKCTTNETDGLTDSSRSIQNVHSVHPVEASISLGTFIENSVSMAFQNNVVKEESTIILTETEQKSSNESVPLFDAQGIKISDAISLAKDIDCKINVPLEPDVLGVDQENTTMTGNSQTAQQHSKSINHLSTTDFFEDMGEYVSNHFPEKQQKQLRFLLWSLITEEEIELLKEEDDEKQEELQIKSLK